MATQDLFSGFKTDPPAEPRRSPWPPVMRWLWLVLPFLSAFVALGDSKSNDYGISEIFLNYHHGFVKRGLIGELLSPIKFLSIKTVGLIELSFLAVLLIGSYLVFGRKLLENNRRSLLVCVLLCSPACLSHFGALIGQPDTILFVLLIFSYFLLTKAPPRIAPLLALAPSIIALLIHEAYPLLFFPAVFAMMWDGLRRKRFTLAAVATHMVVFTAVFLAILHFGKIRIDSYALWHEAQARTSFVIPPAIFVVMSFDLKTQWRVMFMRENWPQMAAAIVSTPFLLPYFIPLWKLAQAANERRREPMLYIGLLSLVVAPLLLCIFGMDFLRWGSAALINLILFILYLDDTAEPGETPITERVPSAYLFAILAYGFALGPIRAASIALITRPFGLLK